MRQEGWPDVISKEVNETFDSLLGSTYTTIGAVAGRTLLPLPYHLDFIPSPAQRDKAVREKERSAPRPSFSTPRTHAVVTIAR